MRSQAIFVASALFSSSLGLKELPCSNPTAVIDSGTIVGTTTTIPSATSVVNKFLGIPFAVSPPNRFMPPEPAKKLQEPLNATQWAHSCMQQFNYPETSREFTMALFGGTPLPNESEDCLYLNVYAPSTGDKNKAVLFWLYGGSLLFGNAGQDYYDGSSFAAAQDVIIVTSNYRVNVFGFSNSEELPLTERNVGFLDQRLALDWVQRNIAAFGGDPRKVTIFGQSAGATSIDRLITTLPHNPPFRAAILQSGQATISAIPNDFGVASWATLVEALNCTNSASHLTCVQKADAFTIKNIIEHAALSFSPVTDNVTQRATPLIDFTLSHLISTVPIMVGTNGQEGRAIVIGEVSTANDLTAFINATFPESSELQSAIAAAYPIGSEGLQTPYDVAAQIFTEFVFQCPAAIISRASIAAGIPTWRYFYNFTSPNIQPPIPGIPPLETFHASEIPVVFGTYPTGGDNSQEVALSKYMQKAWADFAKNPTCGPGWEFVNSAGLNLNCIGCNSNPGGQIISKIPTESRCLLYKPIYEKVTTPIF